MMRAIIRLLLVLSLLVFGGNTFADAWPPSCECCGNNSWMPQCYDQAQDECIGVADAGHSYGECAWYHSYEDCMAAEGYSEAVTPYGCIQ